MQSLYNYALLLEETRRDWPAAERLYKRYGCGRVEADESDLLGIAGMHIIAGWRMVGQG
jgi:hypothetical protein